MAEKPADKNDYALKEQEIDEAFQNPDNEVIPVMLEQEMRKSFIDYAMSVITDRALPDVRDGLKPVHRRILYSMYTQGFTHDKPYRKCATTVGDVLGRFHPHGDAAVYDSLVRLAQDFSMREPLVDGHGNFGSRDGDPPAAYRYTEARLTRIASEMMANINRNTVDFQPNYDEHTEEPVVLPASFPNLLVNGSSGIAVGMTTNIPPHNLGEVIDGTVLLLDDPGASIDELMELIPGPDFPTGGRIMGLSGIRQAYKTGRGRIVVQAHTEIEEMRGGRHRIIVHDLPYMVNKARLIERIAELVKEKRIEGISDIRDESDRHDAIRIIIELKKDATPLVVLNQLYQYTQLQDAFNANMLALVPTEDGKFVPRMVGLRDALLHYIAHHKEVLTRRTRFDLDKAEARLHIVEGLQLAIDNIDKVISIIRSSANEELAKTSLSEHFGLSEKQAQHVVDMRLGRLSGLERDKLQAEHDELEARIALFNKILTDEKLLTDTVKAELLDIKGRYANPRRTEIDLVGDFDIDDESLIEEEQVVITMTNAGYVKRLPVDTYRSQRRGGRGITGVQTREEDVVNQIITTSTHQTLLFFTTKGKVHRTKAYRIPESSRTAKGTAVVNLLNISPDEKVYGVISIDDFSADENLLMGTKKGLVKKTLLSEYANINRSGIIAIDLMEDDELIGVRRTTGEHNVILVTKNGKSLRFDESEVRTTGRDTRGVKGITLAAGDEVISMVSADENQTLLVVSENGYGKRTLLSDYRPQRRGGKGIITYKATVKTGKLVSALLVNGDCDILLINDAGVVIRIRSQEIPVLSRNTIGVKLMRASDNKVVSIAPIREIDEDEAKDTEPDEFEHQNDELEDAESEKSEADNAEPEETVQEDVELE
ncbi:MAG TPA: DNA gyrase subunit A [Clostridiaceae bacterium]|nr:DNA gyrase subunit A [Clostridiaceae bacterium]